MTSTNGNFKRLLSFICQKMKKNKTLEEITEDLEEESSVIEVLYHVMEKFAQEYDTDKVFVQIKMENE